MNGAHWRVALRIARRDAARHRGRSALVVALIALPVALLTFGVVVWATHQETPEEQATAVMGRADATITAPGGQAAATWRADLPDGVRVTPVEISRPHFVEVDGARRDIAFTGMRLDDPLTDGLVDLVEGRAPAGLRETAVSRALLDELDATVGDTLTLTDVGTGLEITGVVERPARLSAVDAVVLPGVLPGEIDRSQWLVDLGTVDAHAVVEAVGGAFGGQPVVSPDLPVLTPRGHRFDHATDTLTMLAALGGLALTEAAIVASAAFAVGARRQLRTMGLMAANGGRRQDLRRVVLAGGLVLGAVGAVLGTGLGLAGSAAVAPFLDGLLDRRVSGLDVPWGPIAAAAIAGLVAALAAAAVPARTASRVPVEAALAAARPVRRPRRRTLVLGSLLVLAGLLLIAFVADRANTRLAGGMSITAITLGAVLVVLGFTCASPAVAGLLGRIARRAPTAARLALRDLARHRTRTGPAISAIMAALALPIAVGLFMASTEARERQFSAPWLAPEHVLVLPPLSEAHRAPDPEQADAVAAAVDAVARASVHSLVADPLPRSGAGPVHRPDPAYPADATDIPAEVSANVTKVTPPESGQRSGRLAAVDDVDAALDAWGLDADERAAATATLRDGGVVVFGVEAVHGPHAAISAGGVHLGRRPVTGVAGGGYVDLPWAVVTRDTAASLRLRPDEEQVLLRAASPLDDEARAAALAAVGNPGTATPGGTPSARDDATHVGFERSMEGRTMAIRWLSLGVSSFVAAAIVVVALALSGVEGRRDRVTLAAVGADPAMRRRFRAAQAFAMTFAAGVLAIPAGLLPAAVTLRWRMPGTPLHLPWEAVAVALVGLPLLAWAAVRLLTREPDLPRLQES